MKKLVTMLVVAAMLSACATSQSYRPVVDMKGVDANRYEVDLKECREYAFHVAGPGTGAVVGAVVGALFGAAVSRAAGSQYDAGAAARVGAVLGGASGAGSGAVNEMNVLHQCLRGRGYHVLN